MTAALTTIDNDPAAAARQALAALDPREAAFVSEFLACGNAREAVIAAGYAESDPGRQARRLRGRAGVRDAIRCAIAARESSARVSHERACELLEQSLLVRVSDLLTYTEDGVPCGLRDRSTLSAAEELRIVRYQSKTHASAKGQRGGVRWMDVELLSPLLVLEKLARFRGWESSSPQFQILLQSIEAPRAAAAGPHGASLALLHGLAETLLSGERLDDYLRAHLDGRHEECARLLCESAAELRAATAAEPRAAIHSPGRAPREIPAEILS